MNNPNHVQITEECSCRAVFSITADQYAAAKEVKQWREEHACDKRPLFPKEPLPDTSEARQ